MAHTKYYNSQGIEVPSVTTVLKLLYKEGLMEWSNYIGKRGIDYTKFLNDKADFGTLVHALVEADIHGEEPRVLADMKTLYEANKCLEKFKVAKESFKINNASTEVTLSCDTYGGTIDLLCEMEIDNREVGVLADFKTSKKPYNSQFIQLGGYLNLLKICKPEWYEKIEYCMIIAINKKVHVQYITKENCEKYFTTLFNSLLNLYGGLKEAKEVKFTSKTF